MDTRAYLIEIINRPGPDGGREAAAQEAEKRNVGHLSKFIRSGLWPFKIESEERKKIASTVVAAHPADLVGEDNRPWSEAAPAYLTAERRRLTPREWREQEAARKKAAAHRRAAMHQKPAKRRKRNRKKRARLNTEQTSPPSKKTM